jgi:hypothetical protein
MLIAVALFTAGLAQPAPANEPIICQVGRSEVGTHIRPKPVCMTRSQWLLVERNTQTQLDRFRDRSSFDPGRAGRAFDPNQLPH